MRSLLTVIAVVTAALGIAFVLVGLVTVDTYVPLAQDAAATVEQMDVR